MLSLRQLVKTYPGATERRVLQGVSLELERGECIAIMGDSGVGKSTLLNLIAGLDVPDSGEIVLEGVSLSTLDEEQRTLLRRRRIGFVFQAFHLLPHMSIAANVGLPLALNGTDAAESRKRVDALLEAVGLLERRESLPRELSGGEMQRVAVARALVHRPALVLADEPTGNLDAESAAHVLALLREQARESEAMLILVTHSLAAAGTMDRVLQLTADGLHPHT
jgi:putative ABC transport system ATP-binding protein